jgi:inner membrane transporter RhtA
VKRTTKQFAGSATSTINRGAEGQGKFACPPHVWFIISAFFHSLGPSLAVLLFPVVGVLGVAWLRIASAALVFALFSRPVRLFKSLGRKDRRLLIAFGVVLAAMNCCFYLALDRLPISLVVAIEFSGTITVALYGLKSARNYAALLSAVAGVFLLINAKWSTDAIGLGWACANGCLFVLYIVLGHRTAQMGSKGAMSRLGAATIVAFLAVAPVGLKQVVHVFQKPGLLLAGLGVGICASVIPYVCDQLAMARLPRASFSILLALLPANATLIGAIVLKQIPSWRDIAGIALVMAGVALHQSSAPRRTENKQLFAKRLEAGDAEMDPS